MVAIRGAHYEPLLPEIDTEFRELDSRLKLRIQQHRTLKRRRDDLLTTPRPEFLATRDEQALLATLEAMEAQLATAAAEGAAPLKKRIQRLKGTLIWTLETEYHARLAVFDKNLRSLDAAMATAQAQYDEFVRSRQAATHSYTGYDKPVERLRLNVGNAIERVEMLMARQGRQLEIVAVDELIVRRQRLKNYGDKARFALADSYDRATQTQASLGETPAEAGQ
jgi:hypothetical protein